MKEKTMKKLIDILYNENWLNHPLYGNKPYHINGEDFIVSFQFISCTKESILIYDKDRELVASFIIRKELPIYVQYSLY